MQRAEGVESGRLGLGRGKEGVEVAGRWWAFAVHPVGGTSTTMEIKNAGGKEPGYKSGTTPGFLQDPRIFPERGKQCRLRVAAPSNAPRR